MNAINNIKKNNQQEKEGETDRDTVGTEGTQMETETNRENKKRRERKDEISKQIEKESFRER